MDTYEILVIILSTTLAVLLILSIILIINLIKITNHIKTITEKAESIADNVDSVGQFFKNAAGPVAVSKVVANIIESIRNKKDTKGDKK